MTDILRVVDILPDEAKHFAQKLHRKKEDIEIYRKALLGDIESTDEERTIVARVSTNDRDRDGEIVEPKGIDLKDFQSNPVLLWAHSYSTPPVGKALWSKTDEKGLVCKFQFAQTQFAEDIYQLYKGGYLRAFSIGFIATDFDSKTKTYNKISLLEVSAVPVPANQNALVMEAYAKGMIASDALKKDFGLEGVVGEVNQTLVDIAASYPGGATISLPAGVHVVRETLAVPADVQVEGVPTKVAPCCDHDYDGDGNCDRHPATVPTEKAEEPAKVESKAFDLKGNPSVSDIFNALYVALNPPSDVAEPGPAKPWIEVMDLYPYDYPSGVCVTSTWENETRVMGQQKYRYADGKATLQGEPTSVAPGYVRLGPTDSPAIREVRQDIGELRKLIEGKAITTAIVEAVEDKVPDTLPEPIPVPAPAPEVKSIITITPPAPVVKSEAEAVLEFLHSKDFDERIRLMVDKAIGRVR